MLKVSRETAERAIRLLEMFATPERAAHEVKIGLDAIAPYTDRRSERVYEVLRLLCRTKRFDEMQAKLSQIAFGN